MLSCYFRALRLGGVLTSPQAAPSGLQMTPPSLKGTENPGKPGSPDFILILKYDLGQMYYAHQVQLNQGPNSCPPYHNSTFHVTEAHALTTQPSVT